METTQTIEISVLVPLFNEQDTIEQLYQRITAVLKKVDSKEALLKCHFERSEKSKSDEHRIIRRFVKIPPVGRNDKTELFSASLRSRRLNVILSEAKI